MRFLLADSFTGALARLPAAGSEGGQDHGRRSADRSRRQGAVIPSHRQVKGPEFLVGAGRPRFAADRAQDGGQPARRLCRSPRQGLCLGRAAADRGAPDDRRGSDRRGAREGRGSRCRHRALNRACRRGGRTVRGRHPAFLCRARRYGAAVGRGAGRLARRCCAPQPRTLSSTWPTHLPAEAAEALLHYATDGTLPISAPPPVADPYAHPDAQRRIRLIVDEEELRQALEYPWERWGVFLHPSQRAVVERRFARPCPGGRLGRDRQDRRRTASRCRAGPQEPAGAAAADDVLGAVGPFACRPSSRCSRPRPAASCRGSPSSDWHGAADELFQLIHGRRPRIVAADTLRTMIAKAAEAAGVKRLYPALSALGVDQRCRCLGHRRAGALCERAAAGPALAARAAPARAAVVGVRAGRRRSCASRVLFTRCRGLSRGCARIMAERERKPFDHIIVDEAQDLGPAELSLLAAIAPPGEDALFFAGDIGQRIFQHPFSWKALGIDVRGRSSSLKVCYCQSARKRDPGSAPNRDPYRRLSSGRPRSPRRGPARVAQCPHERRSGARGEALWAPGGDPRATGASLRFGS